MNSSSELRAFPPVSDFINYVEDIDWENVRYKTLRAMALVGIVVAFIGATLTSFGQWLQDCDPTYDISGMPETEPEIEPGSPAAKIDMPDIKEQLAGLSVYKPPMGFK